MKRIRLTEHILENIIRDTLHMIMEVEEKDFEDDYYLAPVKHHHSKKVVLDHWDENFPPDDEIMQLIPEPEYQHLIHKYSKYNF